MIQITKLFLIRTITVVLQLVVGVIAGYTLLGVGLIIAIELDPFGFSTRSPAINSLLLLLLPIGFIFGIYGVGAILAMFRSFNQPYNYLSRLITTAVGAVIFTGLLYGADAAAKSKYLPFEIVEWAIISPLFGALIGYYYPPIAQWFRPGQD